MVVCVLVVGLQGHRWDPLVGLLACADVGLIGQVGKKSSGAAQLIERSSKDARLRAAELLPGRRRNFVSRL